MNQPSHRIHPTSAAEVISPRPVADLVYRESTPFQLCEFRKHPLYGVQLFLDGDLQISSVDSSYNTAIIAPLLGMPKLDEIAILGGGDGGVLGELLYASRISRSQEPNVTLIDIDESVVRECAKRLSKFNRYSLISPPQSVAIRHDDAFAFIERTREELDAVVYDLTMDPVREGQTREQFIEEIIGWMAKSLRSGGCLSMQCGPTLARYDHSHPDALVLAEIHRAVSAHFANAHYQEVYIPSYEESWTFVSARKP